MSHPPRFCEQCGTPLKPTTRFCGNCGVQVLSISTPPVAPPPSSSQPPPAPPPVQEPVAAEPVIGVLPGLTRSKGLMQTETFCLVVTPGRLVFALITQPMINAAIQQARADAKARGEGILGQVGAQMAYLDILVGHYENISLEETLAEQPGNFFISNAQINKVEIKPIDPRRDAPGHSLVIEATSDKCQFTLRSAAPGETRQLLKEVLGNVVK